MPPGRRLFFRSAALAKMRMTACFSSAFTALHNFAHGDKTAEAVYTIPVKQNERMRKMKIRKATEADMPALHRLLKQVNRIHHEGRPDLFKLGEKYTNEELAAILKDETRPIFVAEDTGGDVKGYAFCVCQNTPESTLMHAMRTLYIDDLCVDENCRGQHIGRALFEHVKTFAKENGFYNLTLNVWSLNDSARRFYESCGLHPQRTTMEVIL